MVSTIGALTAASILLPLASGSANGGGSESPSTTTICSPPNKTFTAKINFSEGHLGYFEFDECEGVNPTIGLKIGETYTFNQGDRSNWYHPMGFAYGPDGALDDQDELEPGITRTDSACAADFTCPAPQYKLNGEFLADAAVPEDFGLDAYEPIFFHPLLDWLGQGTYSIELKFDDATIGQDAFYFCHIHQYMSGRIKFLDASGKPLVAEHTPPLGYEYDVPGEFDRMCGTVGLDDWQLPNAHCPDQFVCGLDEVVDDTHKVFSLCIEAMNCKMVAGMTTNVGKDPLALFNYHMIPHHVNAVDMAKALLPFAPCDDLTKEDDPYCTMQVIAREIINTQNFQIQAMRKVLKQLGAPVEDDCAVTADHLTSGGGDGSVVGGEKSKKSGKSKKSSKSMKSSMSDMSNKSKKEKLDFYSVDEDDEEGDRSDSSSSKKMKKKHDESNKAKSDKCTLASC